MIPSYTDQDKYHTTSPSAQPNVPTRYTSGNQTYATQPIQVQQINLQPQMAGPYNPVSNKPKKSQSLSIVYTRLICLDEGELASLPSVYIKQKYEWVESACCQFEIANTYFAFEGDAQGDIQDGTPFLRIKEKSETCARFCLGPCRPFDVNIFKFVGYNQTGMHLYKDHSKTIMKLKRPFRCTICCFQRPFIDIQSKSGGQDRYLGRVVCPCFCNPCRVGLEIFDDQEKLVYSVKASLCQAMFWIPLPCKSCQRGKFDVFDSEGNVLVICDSSFLLNYGRKLRDAWQHVKEIKEMPSELSFRKVQRTNKKYYCLWEQYSQTIISLRKRKQMPLILPGKY